MTLECYLRMRNDAVYFKKLLIGVSLGDVEIPYHGCPVTLTTAAAGVRTVREGRRERRAISTC